MPGPDALEQRVTGVFFPHGIGHLLGLQVHDVGGVMGDLQGGERKRPEGHPYLRLTRMLEPGVVVTVEPGIYLIDSLLEAAREDERRAHIDWAVVEELQALRRHPDRGQRGRHDRGAGEPHARRIRPIGGVAQARPVARPEFRPPRPCGAWAPAATVSEGSAEPSSVFFGGLLAFAGVGRLLPPWRRPRPAASAPCRPNRPGAAPSSGSVCSRRRAP